MKGYSGAIKTFKSRSPSSPFKNFPTDKHIPSKHAFSVHKVIYEAVGSAHESLQDFRFPPLKMAHLSNHAALDLSQLIKMFDSHKIMTN